MDLPGKMMGVVYGDGLHVNVAVKTQARPDRLLKRLERELIKGKASQRADKKVAARRMRSIVTRAVAAAVAATVAPTVTPTFTSTVAPTVTPTVAPAVASATTSELQRKIARLEAELHSRDRSRQKRNDAFRSLQASEHEKMLDLLDARDHIEGLVAEIARLEEELEESKMETVSWLQRAEKFKGERYQEFAHTIDLVTPPPPRAIEWGILAKQPEFWAGVVGVVTLLVAVYAAGRYLGDNAPEIPLPCPQHIPCPRPPRVESPRALSCPKVECPRVKCPRVMDCPVAPVPPPAEKCRGNGHMMAAYGIGAICGGISTWHTVKAMD